MKKITQVVPLKFAEVELNQVRFTYEKQMGIDYKNEIDAWTKIEVALRMRRKVRSRLSDLKPMLYSFRENLD